MTIIPYSSAGRLLVESRRVASALFNVGDQALFNALVPAFEVDGRDWMQGFTAFHRLTEQCLSSLKSIDHLNRQRFMDAVDTVAAIYSPEQFGSNARSFAQSHFSEVILERLQSADEVLQLKGHAEGYDDAHAKQAMAAIDEILKDFEAGGTSDVARFVGDKLNELRSVLEQFVLYGPEGVRDAVARLIGATALWQHSTEQVPPDTREIIAKIYGIAAKALTVVVWSKETYEAVTWANKAFNLLPTD